MNIPESFSLLSLPFMQRAIIGGILLGIQGGMLGCFVVLRRFALFGDTVGHATILGVVLGTLLGLPGTWSLVIFTTLYGLGVIWLAEKTDLGSDTILSIMLAGSVALGTIGFSFIPGYRGGLLSVLFGDILAIDQTDLIFLGLLLTVTVISLIATLPDQILLTLNPELAKVRGIPVAKYQYIFIILLSLTISLTIRAVGILLANAFLVIPAAAAKLICQDFVPFLLTAIGIGAISGAMGMIVSGIANLPSGPSIVLVQFLFFLGLAFTKRN